jgi:hypothetical protein
MKRASVVACLLIAIGLCSAQTNITQSSQWQRFDTGPFSFSAPPDMERKQAVGIDSYVGYFESPNIILGFDYGQWPNDLSDWPKETKVEFVTIDGKRAKIGRCQTGFGFRFDYASAVYFANVGSSSHGKMKLNMFTSCKSSNDYAIARKVFESIRFKPKP